MPYSMILSSSLVGEDGVRRPWFRHFFFRASVIISIDLEIRSCLTILSSNSRTIHQLVMTQKDWIVNRPWRSVYHCRDMFIWCPKWPKGTIFQSHAKKVDQDVRIGDWFVIFGTNSVIFISAQSLVFQKRIICPCWAIFGYVEDPKDCW